MTLTLRGPICFALVKTERLADQHYKRVTNFAKEMLVWPEEINVHKIRNPAYISDVKPPIAVPPVPPLPLVGGASAAGEAPLTTATTWDKKETGMAGGGALSSSIAANSLRVQPPMKFGNY